MIYEPGLYPYFRKHFGCGYAMATPNYHGCADDHAVVVEIEWDDDADDEDVSQRLETWAGLPCLEWFRFHLHDWEEYVRQSFPDVKVRRLVGYTDRATAIDLHSHVTGYVEYLKRDSHNGR